MCRGSPRHWLERLRCGTIIDLEGNFFDDYSKGPIRAPGVDVNRQLSPSSTAPSNAVTLSTYLNLMHCDYVRIGTTSIRTSKSKRLLRCTVLTFCARRSGSVSNALIVWQQFKEIAKPAFLISSQMPRLGKHTLDHAPRFVPASAQAGVHKTLARRCTRTVCRDDIRNHGSKFVDSLHHQPHAKLDSWKGIGTRDFPEPLFRSRSPTVDWTKFLNTWVVSESTHASFDRAKVAVFRAGHGPSYTAFATLPVRMPGE
jgi:hypothetical protein